MDSCKRQASEVMLQAREKDGGTVAYDWFLSHDGTDGEVREADVDADAVMELALNVREARDARSPKAEDGGVGQPAAAGSSS